MKMLSLLKSAMKHANKHANIVPRVQQGCSEGESTLSGRRITVRIVNMQVD